MRDRKLPLIAGCALVALIVAIVVGISMVRERGVLVEQSGSGPGGETTEVFTVNHDWDLRWSYDCSSSLGNQYPTLHKCNFALTVKQLADCLISPDNPGINLYGAPDHGVVHYHTGGTFYFVIDSDGSWTFTVTGPGKASGVGPSPHCDEG